MKQYTPAEKIQQARLRLVTDLPFFGSIYWRLHILEDDTCKTAWTDGRSLGYNPAGLGAYSVAMILGVFIHEIYHIILKHHLREELNPIFTENHLKFNMAADYALNPMVGKSKGAELPAGCLLDLKRFPDNLMEQIFAALTDEEVKEMKANGGEGMVGEVRPFKDGKATQAEKDAESNIVDQWVNAAGMKANNAGKFSSDEQLLVKRITASAVIWQDELQFLCEEVCKNDYTWARPNVRYMHMGCYLPSLTGYKTPDMLFFVDTSGSLCESQLIQIKAEIRAILSSFEIRVIVVYWDTQYRGHQVFDSGDIFDPAWELEVRGRGGTDFKEFLNWLYDAEADLELDPAAVVVFSDLECSNYPGEDPDLPWLWCQVPDMSGQFNEHYLKYLPEWGRHVTVNVYASTD